MLLHNIQCKSFSRGSFARSVGKVEYRARDLLSHVFQLNGGIKRYSAKCQGSGS